MTMDQIGPVQQGQIIEGLVDRAVIADPAL
jgi:hypothetical protein